MGANNGAVDEHFFEIRIMRQMGKDSMPNAAPRPPGKALVDTVPRPELGRQITPWTARAGDPQHRFDEQPIVGCRAARIAGLARQQRRYPFKLIVTQMSFLTRTDCQQTLAKMTVGWPVCAMAAA